MPLRGDIALSVTRANMLGSGKCSLMGHCGKSPSVVVGVVLSRRETAHRTDRGARAMTTLAWTVVVYALVGGSYVEMGRAGRFQTYQQCEQALAKVEWINPHAAYSCEDRQAI